MQSHYSMATRLQRNILRAQLVDLCLGERLLSPRRGVVPGLSRQVLQAEPTGILSQPSMCPRGIREVDGQATFMIACSGLCRKITGSFEILLIEYLLLLSGTMRRGNLQVHSVSLCRFNHRFHITGYRSLLPNPPGCHSVARNSPLRFVGSRHFASRYCQVEPSRLEIRLAPDYPLRSFHQNLESLRTQQNLVDSSSRLRWSPCSSSSATSASVWRPSSWVVPIFEG